MKSRNTSHPHTPRSAASLWIAASAVAGVLSPGLAAPATANGDPIVGGAKSESYYMGGRQYTLPAAQNWVGVQVKPNASSKLIAGIQSETALDDKRTPLRYAGDHLLLLPVDTQAPSVSRRKLKTRLSRSKTVQRVVRLFGNGKKPFIDNGQFIVRFKSGVSDAQARALLARSGATPLQSLRRFAPGEYLARVSDPANSSLAVSSRLYLNPQVVFSHPNFLMPLQKRSIPNDPLFARQWHLNNTGQSGGRVRADVRAADAWNITKGSPNITIAILDDGVDIKHEDFGAAKLVPGFDFVDNDADPSPVNNDAFNGDHHGTACAGVATATGFNGIGVSGVAPGCKLMSVRMLGNFTTTLQQAEAFYFAAGRSSGGRGADVISNSWGPDDPNTPLPDVVKQAIDYAVTKGRGGKGCVVLFAAGNSSSSADSDGYASYAPVIGVTASTNQDDHAGYSSFGESVDLCAPSSGGTLDITTVDRMGVQGYSTNNYASDFGGTSSACPVVAGVAALVLSREPNLSGAQVRQRLIATADKIDSGGGSYDSRGHSRLYGYGRVNALKALAQADALPNVTLVSPADNTRISGDTVLRATTTNDSVVSQVSFEQRRLLGNASKTSNRAIPDDDPNGLSETLVLNGDARLLQAELTVTARIQHEYIGDLQVVLIEPNGRRTTLYDGTGGAGKEILISQTLPVAARSGAGTYTLQVIDTQQQDVGTLVSFGIDLKTLFSTIAVDSNRADNAANGNQWTATLRAGMLAGGLYDFRATALVPATTGGTVRTFSDTNTNITIIGAPARPYNVSGRVIDRNRLPVQGVRIVIEDGSGRSATTDAQGNFTLPSVISGEYRLRAVQVGSIFVPEVVAVSVGSEDRSGITFVLSSRDTVPPTVQITAPSGAATQVFTSLPLVSGTAADNIANGVRQVTVRLSRYATSTTPGGFYNPATKTFDPIFDPLKHEMLARGTTRWNLALPVLQEGRYALQATATDRANNSTRSAVVTFTIDRTNPTVTIITPASNTSYTLGALRTATGAASDNFGIARISGLLFRYATSTQPGVYYNGRQWVATPPTEAFEPTATFNGKTWTLPLPSLSSGRYYLRITARDRVGNVSRVTNIFRVAPSTAKSSEDVSLSSTAASASFLLSQVTLDFAAAVDADSAESARFSVTANGLPIDIEGVSANNGGITLSLPEGALRAGDAVNITWSALNSSQGNPIADGTTTTVAE